MDIFLYIILFIIGTLFGSFYTLAVYRIPKGQDITHTHSYCPNCNHKLGLLDLFPIFSYILLGGKCRYCKEKIRPRYFILECLSGLVFILIAYVMNIRIETLTITKIAEYSFMALYVTYIFLISGIDKENRNMNKPVNIYGIVISIMYMVYLCIVEQANIYRYGIYMFLILLILILDTITLKKFQKDSYTYGILLMLMVMVFFTGEYITANSVILTLLSMAIYILLFKLKKVAQKLETDEQAINSISIGLYLGVSNLVIFILVMLYTNHIC